MQPPMMMMMMMIKRNNIKSQQQQQQQQQLMFTLSYHVAAAAASLLIWYNYTLTSTYFPSLFVVVSCFSPLPYYYYPAHKEQHHQRHVSSSPSLFSSSSWQHQHSLSSSISSSSSSFSYSTRLWSLASNNNNNNNNNAQGSITAKAAVRSETATAEIALSSSSSSSLSLSSSFLLFNTTVSFPCYHELMKLQSGEFITSQPFTVMHHDFCVKLYPRGGGHKTTSSSFSVFNNKKNCPSSNNEQDIEKSGFGMSYQQQQKLPPLFGKQQQEEKVGAYLQFLPRHETDTVDATFTLRLQGQQSSGKRRFDIEWKAGMRFVSLSKTKLVQGQANDFGAYLLQTHFLSEFLGITTTNRIDDNDDDDDDSTSNGSIISQNSNSNRPITMQVQIQIHEQQQQRSRLLATGNVADADGDDTSATNNKKETEINGSSSSSSSGAGTSTIRRSSSNRLASILQLQDIRNNKNGDDDDDDDDDLVRVGRIVVPVLQTLAQRPEMFRQGIYPGVEYRILRIINSTTNQDLFYYPKSSSISTSRSTTTTTTTAPSTTTTTRTHDDIDYELKPIYPLVSQLERQWPVRIKDSDIPKLLTGNQYNLLSALGSIVAATTGLLTAFIISQAVSLFFIPSRSMDPTLQVGDVLLVEKVTPRLASALSLFLTGNNDNDFAAAAISTPHTNDIVLFHPPEPLLDIVRNSGGRITDRDLFIKRIAALPGDSWSVTQSGQVQIFNNNNNLPAEQEQQQQQQSINRRLGGHGDLCTTDEPLRLIERYIQPHDVVLLQPQQVVVLGDCATVSVDSRVWGPLSTLDIVGRPLFRIWPISRIGLIDDVVQSTSSSSTTTIPATTVTSTTMDADWSN